MFNSDYSPWVEDDFFFHEQGEQREYTITPKRFSRPELYLYDKDCVIPQGLFTTAKGKPVYQFKWDVQVNVIKNGKIIESINLKPQAAGLGGFKEGHDCYSFVSFNTFDSISDLNFPKEVTIQIKVLKADDYYANKSSGLLFGIRHSPIK